MVAGVTIMLDVVAPVLHEYVETPVAISVALWPEHTAGELTTIAGAALTETLTFCITPIQPAVLVPFTV